MSKICCEACIEGLGKEKLKGRLCETRTSEAAYIIACLWIRSVKIVKHTADSFLMGNKEREQGKEKERRRKLSENDTTSLLARVGSVSRVSLYKRLNTIYGFVRILY